MSILLRVVRGKQHMIPRWLDIVVIVIAAQLPEVCSINERLFGTRDDVGKHERTRCSILDNVGPIRGVGNPLKGGPRDTVATPKVVGEGGELAFVFGGGFYRCGRSLGRANCESKQEGPEGGADCELVSSRLSVFRIIKARRRRGEGLQPTNETLLTFIVIGGRRQTRPEERFPNSRLNCECK